MANQIYVGRISEISKAISMPHFFGELEAVFKHTYGRSASPNEVESWQNSLPQLVQLLANSELGGYHILLEYRLPFDEERCDVILLGCEPQNSINAVVIELKQWSSVDPVDGSSDMVLVPGIGLASHPSYQVGNYVGKIRNFHSHSSVLTVSGCVFVHNSSSTSPAATALMSNEFMPLVKASPIYFGDQSEQLLSFIVKAIGINPCSPSQITAFSEGTYIQSIQFFDGITNHAADIANRVTENIISSGWGLSEVQLSLKNDVLLNLEDGEMNLYLVYGEPGSGKSLLAVQLLLEVIPSKKQVVMGLVNNRLMSALRSCLDKSYPGSSGALKYFTPRFGHGIANAPENVCFDIVICDEGQRMSIREMTPILKRAPVVVIFYDQYQRLLSAEQGTRENFQKVAVELGLNVKEYRLTSNYRCKGGNAYQTWVETLLSTPATATSIKESDWETRYRFQVYTSLPQMLDDMRQLNQTTGRDVCLLASFTESDGNTEKVRTQNPKLIWAMKGEEYIDFWVNRRSNKLENCASIFGCQGFERSFAGIIWGKDYAYRNGSWQIHPQHTITDYIGRPSLLKLVQTGRQKEALDFIYNRYRILLTRGIDGTFVYCEDEETRDFLLALQA